MLGEYNKSASSPFQKLNETMQDTAYTTHTYKHTTIGFLADIQDMPNQYAYSRTVFRPLVSSRELHADRGGRREARRPSCRWRSSITAAGNEGRRRSTIPVEPPQTEPKVGAADLAVADAADVVPRPTISRPPIRRILTRPRCGALEQALFGETSPLYKELVLKEQKAVMLTAEAEPKRDPGLFSIFVRVRKPDDLPVVRARISTRLWPRRPKRRSTRPD